VKKLLGDSEIEAILQRLDRLIEDEARMTVTQTLGVVHGLGALAQPSGSPARTIVVDPDPV
jgi:hypothetical protein